MCNATTHNFKFVVFCRFYFIFVVIFYFAMRSILQIKNRETAEKNYEEKKRDRWHTMNDERTRIEVAAAAATAQQAQAATAAAAARQAK